MEVNENNSVLSINNSFYKVFQAIKDKKSKNEATNKEVDWIQLQLLSENQKICSNAVIALVSVCGIETGFALNSFVSALPRTPTCNFEIVANGMFELLLSDISTENYNCPFGILYKPHPLLLLLDDSSDRMLFLSHKIVAVLNSLDR